MDFRESIRHNKRLALLPGRKARSEISARDKFEHYARSGYFIGMVETILMPSMHSPLTNKLGCCDRGDDIRRLLSRKSLIIPTSVFAFCGCADED